MSVLLAKRHVADSVSSDRGGGSGGAIASTGPRRANGCVMHDS